MKRRKIRLRCAIHGADEELEVVLGVKVKGVELSYALMDWVGVEEEEEEEGEEEEEEEEENEEKIEEERLTAELLETEVVEESVGNLMMELNEEEKEEEEERKVSGGGGEEARRSSAEVLRIQEMKGITGYYKVLQGIKYGGDSAVENEHETAESQEERLSAQNDVQVGKRRERKKKSTRKWFPLRETRYEDNEEKELLSLTVIEGTSVFQSTPRNESRVKDRTTDEEVKAVDEGIDGQTKEKQFSPIKSETDGYQNGECRVEDGGVGGEEADQSEAANSRGSEEMDGQSGTVNFGSFRVEDKIEKRIRIRNDTPTSARIKLTMKIFEAFKRKRGEQDEVLCMRVRICLSS